MLAARRRFSRLVAAAAIIVAAVVLVPALLPGLGDLNPFDEKTVDRSPPVLLRSLERLNEYRASSANLQVVVDVEEDTELVPSFIKGSRTLIVASGSVDGAVDFRGLSGRNLEVSGDRRSVTVTLPPAGLTDPRLDMSRTRVFDRDRGLVDRVGEAFGDGGADEERRLLELAQQRLAQAARQDPDILRSAERNTRSMLEGMLRGLGFERVTVRFSPELRA